MSNEVIVSRLMAKFKEPLADGLKRRIVFWNDDGSFRDLVEELAIPDVKVLILTGSNNFYAKKLLLHDDLLSDYLVYNPISYTSAEDDWLVDLECYSSTFSADKSSMLIDELHIPSTLADAVRSYSKFFESKERKNKFASFNSDNLDNRQLHTNVMAVLCDTRDNSVSGIVKAIIKAGFDSESDNECVSNIAKFGNMDAFKSLISNNTGYSFDDKFDTREFAIVVLLNALTMTMNASHLNGLERYINVTYQNSCYAIINDWMHSSDSDDLFNIANSITEQLHLADRFKAMQVADLLTSECLPCINECILYIFMEQVLNDVINADDIVAAVEKRKTTKWYHRVSNIYEGMLCVAKMRKFYQDNAGGFHAVKFSDVWDNYASSYYLMDTYYRHFCAAYVKARDESSATDIQDKFTSVAERADNLYKNWYLDNLGTCWSGLIKDELEKSAWLPNLPRQDKFYSNNVYPITKDNHRAVVIISDALRYEVAVELKDRLIREENGNASINAMQGVFPTITAYGMAALLCGMESKMTHTAAKTVTIDDMPCVKTAERVNVLRGNNKTAVAFYLKDFLDCKREERKEAVKGAEVVYLYHNIIDATGEARATEDKVFEDCETAIVELKNAVRVISNDLSVGSIIITSDHGFIATRNALEESDKIGKDVISGSPIEADRRYVIADSTSSADYLIKVSLDHLNTTNIGYTPMSYIRLKTPGGERYVHGGVSLQELMVPVITYTNVRKGSKKFEAVEKAGLQLVTQSRKITNNITTFDFLQSAPVGGKVTAGKYTVYLTDVSGQIISDKQSISAERTNQDPVDRQFRTRLTLKGSDFDKTQIYYLQIWEEENGLVEQVEFSIDITFAADDFGF